jgi:hypothetical protein
MEDVIDLYHLPYCKNVPLICMDEQPVQLIGEEQIPLPVEPGKPKRYDYHYKRNGTAVNFMFTEPLGNWRKVNIRERKTSIDWAQEIKELLDVDYPDAKKVILVCDNLNTHKIGSFYEAFDPTEARRLVKRLEIHYTPKHGSWLNIAEIELSVLTKQCLNRRIGKFDLLKKEVNSWVKERNKKQKGIDWQFTTRDARIKLKSLYPQFQL